MFDHLKSVEKAVLTNREKEVLELLGEGQNPQKIAFSLDLSIYTIKTYLNEIYSKTGIRDNILLAVSINKLKHQKELEKIQKEHNKKLELLYEIIRKDCKINEVNEAYKIIKSVED